MSDWGPFDLTGKAAIVTGGASGIGLGIAKCLADAGANVVIADIDGAAAAASANALVHCRGDVRSIEADVSSTSAGALLADYCISQFSTVDVLVNNAGVFPLAPFLEQTEVTYDRMMAVNLRGAYFTTQSVVARMIELGRAGVVVNIASRESIRPSFAGLTVYAATKGGLVQMTKNLALELAPNNIRVIAISPGGVAPTGGASKLPQSEVSTLKYPLEASQGHRGQPHDIGWTTVFLASDAGRWLTGINILVDGGGLLT